MGSEKGAWPVLMRRSWCWFALVLILSGAPARQVEAAADQARTMAEIGAGDRVEEEDGGVGDDSLEATIGNDPGAADLGQAVDAAPLPSILAHAPVGFAAGPVAMARLGGVEAPAQAGRRQARLGRFRF